MNALLIAIFTTALCLAGASAEAKGSKGGKTTSAFKGGKTTSGHSFPSKAPKFKASKSGKGKK